MVNVAPPRELRCRVNARLEPVNELHPEEYLVVRTEQAPDRLADVVRAALARSSPTRWTILCRRA